MKSNSIIEDFLAVEFMNNSRRELTALFISEKQAYLDRLKKAFNSFNEERNKQIQ